MSNNFKALEKIVAQISSPADLLAALSGSALGGGITQITHGGNLIAYLIFGAGLGMAVKKSLIASFQRPLLKRRANNLRYLIIKLPPSPERGSLLQRLDLETGFWKNGLTTNSEFRNQLSKLIRDFRSLHVRKLFL